MESSREKMLSELQRMKWSGSNPPAINYSGTDESIMNRFVEVCQSIGGKTYSVKDIYEARAILKKDFANVKRVVSPLSAFSDVAERREAYDDLSSLHDVDLFITAAIFAVAENGAIWLTEERMGERVLPFICQHLAVIVNRKMIVPNMHDAYEIIGQDDFSFAVFIAGPSKTADIEQSLVLGAHGPGSMHVFILDEV